MNETKILAAVTKEKSNYDSIVEHVNLNEFGPEGKLIWSEIQEYYSVDPEAKDVDLEILSARLTRRLPNPKHAQACIGVLKSLPDVSGTNVVREVIALKTANLGLEIGQAFASGKPDTEVKPLVEKWLEWSDRGSLENENEELVNVSLPALVGRRLSNERLIQLAPKALNDRLDGGALPGHHVLVFAPTEMGKTLFVINMAAHFLRQGLRVLYVGNEDPADDIILRLATRITGLDKFRIRDNADAAQQVLEGAGWGNFIFADLAPGTFPRINRLVQTHKPAVLILDQLSNINVNVSKSESRTGSLEEAAKQARSLAKRHNVLVVSVTQAADSATGRIVLGRGDVHNSNVGIPGQVDLMLGIGADEQMEHRGLREISIVKNKISGNHDHFTVRFNPVLSKVEV